MTLHLIGFLKNPEHAHVEKVWVNKKGEFHLRETKGFAEYSREEILAKEKDLLKKLNAGEQKEIPFDRIAELEKTVGELKSKVADLETKLKEPQKPPVKADQKAPT